VKTEHKQNAGTIYFSSYNKFPSMSKGCGRPTGAGNELQQH